MAKSLQMWMGNIPDITEDDAISHIESLGLPPPHKIVIRVSKGNVDAKYGVASWWCERDREKVFRSGFNWPGGKYCLMRLACVRCWAPSKYQKYVIVLPR